jgi:hypothetical protein
MLAGAMISNAEKNKQQLLVLICGGAIYRLIADRHVGTGTASII